MIPSLVPFEKKIFKCTKYEFRGRRQKDRSVSITKAIMANMSRQLANSKLHSMRSRYVSHRDISAIRTRHQNADRLEPQARDDQVFWAD